MQTIQQKLPPPPPFTAVLMMSPTLSCVQVNRYKATRILTIEFFFYHLIKFILNFKTFFFLSYGTIFFPRNYFYFYKFLGWIKCEKLNIFVFKVIPELLGENYYHYVIWQHFQSMMRQGYYRHNKISFHKI